jgi:hypothetical protein
LPRERIAHPKKGNLQGEWAIEVLRRFLTFLIDNIILVVAGVVIASKGAHHYGLTFGYKKTFEGLMRLFEQLNAWLLL